MARYTAGLQKARRSRSGAFLYRRLSGAVSQPTYAPVAPSGAARWVGFITTVCVAAGALGLLQAVATVGVENLPDAPTLQDRLMMLVVFALVAVVVSRLWLGFESQRT